MSEVLQPSLRFKGFTDTWEHCELGDISDVTKLAGFEFTEYVQYSDSGKIIALRGLNVKNNSLVLDEVKYIDGSEFSKLKRSKLYKNDMLLTYVGTVGALAVVPENDKYYLAPNVARVRFKKQVYPKYASQLMGSRKFYNEIIIPLIATSSQPALSMENVRKFKLNLPNLKEQKEIGKLFNKIDNLITLHQRKYDRLVNVKRALLDKMFPKNGEVVPKLRFKGFTDAWEQCSFENIFYYERPDEYIVESDKYSNQFNIPVLTANKGFILGYTNETRTYNRPCLIFDDFTMDSKLVDFPFMVKSSAMKMLTTKCDFDLRFSYELLNSSKIENLGHARHYISVVQPTEVKVPKYDEQVKLSKLFRSIDSLITLHQRKYETLKNMKKALLEKMFV